MGTEILLLLTDKWNDWEASYVIAVANSFSDYKVKTIGINKEPKISMGGIRANIDYSIDEYEDFSNLSILILPGGLSWMDSEYDEIASFVKQVEIQNVTIAAICGSSHFLCRKGFLNDKKHTGDSFELFNNTEGYDGSKLYIESQVVFDKGFLTANETAAVEFAYEIFKILEIDKQEELDIWFENFQNGAINYNKSNL